jgi:hypothetical protein
MLDTCLGEYRHQLRDPSRRGFCAFPSAGMRPGRSRRSIEMRPLKSQIIVGKISAHDWPGSSRLLANNYRSMRCVLCKHQKQQHVNGGERVYVIEILTPVVKPELPKMTRHSMH